jgi:Fe-S-cluster-containing dehydrogenase component
MPAPANVVIDTGLCTACRACELACHFHHTGHFGTSRMSVHVEYEPVASRVTLGFDDTCDGCRNEQAPVCASACVPAAIVFRP